MDYTIFIGLGVYLVLLVISASAGYFLVLPVYEFIIEPLQTRYYDKRARREYAKECKCRQETPKSETPTTKSTVNRTKSE